MTAREDTGTDRGASRATDRHHPWAGRSALVIPVVVFALGLFLVYGIIDMEIPADSEEVFGPTAFPTISAIASTSEPRRTIIAESPGPPALRRSARRRIGRRRWPLGAARR